MTRSLCLLLLLSCANIASADGGRLRLHERAGPFVVTLFSTPDPLVAGQADFSAAIERPGTGGLIENASVTYVLTPADGGHPLVLHASHAAATSRFLQAANFMLPHAGIWQVTVVVQQGDEVGKCYGSVRVFPVNLAKERVTWDVAVVPFAAFLFVLHQWRKRNYRKSRHDWAAQAKTRDTSRL